MCILAKSLPLLRKSRLLFWKSIRPKRRISLGLKQNLSNPWDTFAEQFPQGTVVEGEVKNKTEFGLFIGLDGDVDGMVHLSDLDWNMSGEEAIENFNKGDMVKAVVLDVDVDKERISLGIKQLDGADPMDGGEGGEIRKNSIVTAEVLKVTDGGLEVKIVDTDIEAFVKRFDLSRDRDEQRPRAFLRWSEDRCPCHPVRQEKPQGQPVDQGAGDR